MPCSRCSFQIGHCPIQGDDQPSKKKDPTGYGRWDLLWHR